MTKPMAALLPMLLFATSPTSATPGPSFAAVQARDLTSALRLLDAWWPGEYDNHEQVIRQSGGGLSTPSSTPFRRLHSIVKPLAAPVLGDHVVAIEQYADNQPATILKREIATYAVDPAMNAIRVKRYRLTSSQKLDDPSAIATLAPSKLVPLGGKCDLLLRYIGGQFQGQLASDRCPAESGNAEYELVIGKDYQWERGQARQERSGKIVWEMAPGSGYGWYQQPRARPFTCNIFEDAKGEMAKTKFLKTIHLHDQGGEADVAWPDGRTLTFTIHQRAFTATPERLYPLFRVHEKGNPIPIAYAYAVDSNSRFGLNLGWFYIRCYDDRDIATVDMLEAKK